MRLTIPAAAISAGLLAACASSVHVRTTADPRVPLTGLHTFAVLETPHRRSGASKTDNDPMLQNSITNRALRRDLITQFEARGYTLDSVKPDFTVAYYATAHEKVDPLNYDYGHDWRPGWWGPISYPDVQQYTQGTVIVDAINPTTKQLEWRGRGVARVSDDPQAYAKELDRTVAAIVDRFPSIN
jgi:Domain of unknown function (DUF4136)